MVWQNATQQSQPITQCKPRALSSGQTESSQPKAGMVPFGSYFKIETDISTAVYKYTVF